MGRMKTARERMIKALEKKKNPPPPPEKQIKGFRESTVREIEKEFRERQEQSKFKNDLVNNRFSQLNIPQKKG